MANSFIGNMLRMELLSRAGRSRQILEESIDYLLYMADRTGTLWENTEPSASCDHGFASHIVHTLYRDVLGVRYLDPLGRKLVIQFADVPLEFCQGTLPTVDGDVRLFWRRGENRSSINYACRLGITSRSRTKAGSGCRQSDGCGWG